VTAIRKINDFTNLGGLLVAILITLPINTY
jgi:hypothetical protein